ncbi:hypothetical protein P2G88_10095 [Aliiglaciecola sp. CAU 1673]|uniref:hypothetical protein n=1 Tax=Aliiglaciecola sp. CAU 1673 TaxID=3032595 RepID=UPI0023DAC024|nr:hypothetical protein [Aliiglaciecola sp. CAU 1673]MDF2178598.1 hypothetical protein [Aliiglaciecola sp. CAU 1673]
MEYTRYKQFNESLNIKDNTFCDFLRGEDLCLLGINKQKYAVDIKNLDAKRIIQERNTEQATEPARLENLDKMEYEILVYFAIYVEDGIRRLRQQSLQSISKPNLSSHRLTHSIVSSNASGVVCGPASDPLIASLIPDQPFLNACINHDMCYASFRNKYWCDEMFLAQMREIAEHLAQSLSIDFPFEEQFLFGALMTMAYTYHAAVVHLDTALLAYCANKGTSCIVKKGELNVVSSNGSAIAGSGDGGSGSIFPPELYNNGRFCVMPVQYYTCAHNSCIPGLIYIPCP